MSFLKAQAFFLQILHQYSVPSKITPPYVFSSNMLYILWSKAAQTFEVFECSDENLPKSSYHFPNCKEVFLQILHYSSVSWKITPQYFFRSKAIYFGLKGPIKVQILETFEYPYQNSPNSCQFWNNKLFVQILHQSSLSISITPLYFFSWNCIYLQQNEPTKVQIWWN